MSGPTIKEVTAGWWVATVLGGATILSYAQAQPGPAVVLGVFLGSALMVSVILTWMYVDARGQTTTEGQPRLRWCSDCGSELSLYQQLMGYDPRSGKPEVRMSAVCPNAAVPSHISYEAAARAIYCGKPKTTTPVMVQKKGLAACPTHDLFQINCQTCLSIAQSKGIFTQEEVDSLAQAR